MAISQKLRMLTIVAKASNLLFIKIIFYSVYLRIFYEKYWKIYLKGSEYIPFDPYVCAISEIKL